MSRTYLGGMIARLVTMLAIFAVALATTLAAAHATRLSVAPDQAGHAMQASPDGPPSCAGERHCRSADHVLCDIVCLDLPAFLTSPGVEAGHAYEPAGHRVISEARHLGHAPPLHERPPKLRLL